MNTLEKRTCKKCQYYRQHYTFSGGRIIRVYCGHCTISRAKHKRPDADTCENFLYSPSQEDIFATKEYLSKTLLQYVLNLDLLPEIEDEG